MFKVGQIFVAVSDTTFVKMENGVEVSEKPTNDFKVVKVSDKSVWFESVFGGATHRKKIQSTGVYDMGLYVHGYEYYRAYIDVNAEVNKQAEVIDYSTLTDNDLHDIVLSQLDYINADLIETCLNSEFMGYGKYVHVDVNEFMDVTPALAEYNSRFGVDEIFCLIYRHLSNIKTHVEYDSFDDTMYIVKVENAEPLEEVESVEPVAEVENAEPLEVESVEPVAEVENAEPVESVEPYEKPNTLKFEINTPKKYHIEGIYRGTNYIPRRISLNITLYNTTLENLFDELKNIINTYLDKDMKDNVYHTLLDIANNRNKRNLENNNNIYLSSNNGSLGRNYTSYIDIFTNEDINGYDVYISYRYKSNLSVNDFLKSYDVINEPVEEIPNTEPVEEIPKSNLIDYVTKHFDLKENELYNINRFYPDFIDKKEFDYIIEFLSDIHCFISYAIKLITKYGQYGSLDMYVRSDIVERIFNYSVASNELYEDGTNAIFILMRDCLSSNGRYISKCDNTLYIENELMFENEFMNISAYKLNNIYDLIEHCEHFMTKRELLSYVSKQFNISLDSTVEIYNQFMDNLYLDKVESPEPVKEIEKPEPVQEVESPEPVQEVEYIEKNSVFKVGYVYTGSDKVQYLVTNRGLNTIDIVSITKEKDIKEYDIPILTDIYNNEYVNILYSNLIGIISSTDIRYTKDLKSILLDFVNNDFYGNDVYGKYTEEDVKRTLNSLYGKSTEEDVKRTLNALYGKSID